MPEPVNVASGPMVSVLVLVSVQLSYELSRHEARIRRLAEEVALLRQQIERAGTILTVAEVQVVAIRTSGGAARLPAGLRAVLPQG